MRAITITDAVDYLSKTYKPKQVLMVFSENAAWVNDKDGFCVDTCESIIKAFTDPLSFGNPDAEYYFTFGLVSMREGDILIEDIK